jgi:hypothetical protein
VFRQIIEQPAPRLPGMAADRNPVFDGDADRLCCTEALHWVSERRGRFDHVI